MAKFIDNYNPKTKNPPDQSQEGTGRDKSFVDIVAKGCSTLTTIILSHFYFNVNTGRQIQIW